MITPAQLDGHAQRVATVPTARQAYVACRDALTAGETAVLHLAQTPGADVTVLLEVTMTVGSVRERFAAVLDEPETPTYGGLDDDTDRPEELAEPLARLAHAVNAALERHRPSMAEPETVLACQTATLAAHQILACLPRREASRR
jgi:hypothetical protein